MMLGLPDTVFVSLLLAFFSGATNTVLLIVLYLTLRQAKSLNAMNSEYQKTQLLREKHSLTFAFADWVATEVKYYSPLYKTYEAKEKVLNPEKINKHLISIAKKMTVLCNDGTVDKSLMRDEIDRMRLTLESMNVDSVEVESDLKILLD